MVGRGAGRVAKAKAAENRGMTSGDSGDPGELGRRLREARRAAGLTQGAVAERVGMARTTLVAIEQGERPVGSHELIQLAKIYGRAVNELVRAAPATLELAPQFRAAMPGAQAAPAQEAGELEHAAAELQRRAEDYAALEALLGARMKAAAQPEYDASGADAERLGEAAAAAERNRLGMGDGPVGDLRERLAELGLRIFYFPMPSRVAGLFAYSSDLGGVIGVNTQHPPERRRWTLAHEWGHFLMTRRQAEVTVLGRGGRAARREILADSFAKNVLMPGEGLSRRFTEAVRASERGITLADVCGLASLYAVSLQAMVLRLEDLGRLVKGTWERLREEGFKPTQARRMLGLEREPAAEDAFPARYMRLAAEAFAKGLVSEGQLARYLRTDRVSARGQIEALASEVRAEDGGEFKPVAAGLGDPLPAR